eukprot:CAMPEP_0184475694 /NCGR_PEP_ID=MMETSP0740-20130409/146694_1 /TAXON_ID=385413 /ORGANISM="Thalassiosira miniscula, Strain CCMP1093" /LENGTH=240 /DNA_ID=CAMNT_0026853227 /DNA_START=115 /DNA_END=837 /DNA_ORIENTATION=+
MKVSLAGFLATAGFAIVADVSNAQLTAAPRRLRALQAESGEWGNDLSLSVAMIVGDGETMDTRPPPVVGKSGKSGGVSGKSGKGTASTEEEGIEGMDTRPPPVVGKSGKSGGGSGKSGKSGGGSGKSGKGTASTEEEGIEGSMSIGGVMGEDWAMDTNRPPAVGKSGKSGGGSGKAGKSGGVPSTKSGKGTVYTEEEGIETFEESMSMESSEDEEEDEEVETTTSTTEAPEVDCAIWWLC